MWTQPFSQSPSETIEVLIVGAGPAGLAVAGRLRGKGADFVLMDRASELGSSWRAHYDRLHLHTVKELSHLPGLPFPDAYPRYVPRHLVVEYLDAYAREFDIRPRLDTSVEHIARAGTVWKVETTAGTVRTSHVVVATGVNRLPKRPRFPGEQGFRGTVLHSRDYRRGDAFGGQRVLVVGMGNTGAEIALDLLEHGADVCLSVRGPVNIVPRDVLGRPTHLTAITLGKLPPRLGGFIGDVLRRLTVGDLTRYGIPTPDIAPIEQLRRFAKTPVVDVGTVAQIKAGRIAVRPAIDRFERDSVRFTDGSEERLDAVVLATGYRAGVQDFFPASQTAFDANGYPASWRGTGALEGAYFVGFNNYEPGGVLGSIVRESGLVADLIATSRSGKR